jgi:hypothetical protein
MPAVRSRTRRGLVAGPHGRAILRAEHGFRLAPIVAPCCGGATTLNELAYEWPLGFARWTTQVLYPERGWLTDDELREVELALEHPVRQTFRHI